MAIDRSHRRDGGKMRDISECFDLFSENKGYLDKGDLKVAMTALLGFRPSKYDIQHMMASAADTDPLCPGMSKQHFVEVMIRRLAAVDSTEEVRHIFQAFDRGCRGFITRDDMRNDVDTEGDKLYKLLARPCIFGSKILNVDSLGRASSQVISEVFSENEMSSAKVAEMFAEADVDGNGRVGYQEFERMVSNHLPADRLQMMHPTRNPSF